jgi:hypothetical protein
LADLFAVFLAVFLTVRLVAFLTARLADFVAAFFLTALRFGAAGRLGAAEEASEVG